MAVESIVIGIAFFASVSLLFKPGKKAINDVLSRYSKGIASEVDSLEERLHVAREALRSAIQSDARLEDDIEKILAHARDRAIEMTEAAKKRVEEEFSSALERVRVAIEEENRMFLLRLKLSLVDEVSSFVRDFGKGSLQDVDHEVMIKNMAEQLSINLARVKRK